jgi:hypothetical protein
MTVESSSAFIQSNSFSAEITRRAAMGAFLKRGASIGSIAGGLVAGSDSQIVAGSGMHVEVPAGEILVPGSSSATQSGYYLRVSATETLTIAASDPSNPRIDRISAVIKDAAYTGAENLGTLAVETGTPTSGATLANLSGVAAAPASSLTLGYVLVGAGVSSLSAEKISNIAERVVPGLSTATFREGTQAARPAAGTANRLWYSTDIHVLWVDTGSEWKQLTPSSARSVVLGEEERTNAAYGKLATPDQVELYVPENALILFGFQGLVKQSVASAGRVAIFLGSNQVSVREGSGIVLQSVGIGGGTTGFAPISTGTPGLVVGSEAASPPSDVTTGQIVSAQVTAEKSGLTGIFWGGAAGTLTISVQYKSTSGSVTAKGRRLWATAFV